MFFVDSLPKSQELIHPLLKVLASKSGSLTNDEIGSMVAETLGLSLAQISQIHSGSRTELSYRLGWAKTNAKSKGWIQSSKRENWEITPAGLKHLNDV